MKPIVRTPNPVLTTPAKRVTKFDKKLVKIIEEMKEALLATRNPKGVGLAAPQIGVGIRLFITRPKESDPIRIFVNPEILENSKEEIDSAKERDGKLEGCLSIPNLWGNVRRAQSLTIRFQDETGEKHEESFKGFPAIIAQHEIDHLEGTLFAQRVLEQKGKFYQTTKDEDGKEVLEEVDIK
jgi:peptide deformylase